MGLAGRTFRFGDSINYTSNLSLSNQNGFATIRAWDQDWTIISIDVLLTEEYNIFYATALHPEWDTFTMTLFFDDERNNSWNDMQVVFTGEPVEPQADVDTFMTWLLANSTEVIPQYITNKTELTSIANAIRAKGGTSALLVYPNDFVSAINAIFVGVDVSDTTATGGDVLSGKYFYNSSGVKTPGSLIIQHYYTGTGDPSSSLGVDGDIYLKM